MPSYTMYFLLLIALLFGGRLTICETVPESLLQLENESSRKLHPKFNLHAEKLQDSSEEKVVNLGYNTTRSVTKNSMLPSDTFKTNGVAKAAPRVESFRGGFRRHARKKRNTKNEFLPWNFNLNVSRLDTQNSESSSKGDVTIPKLRIEKPGKHLDIALHVKGNDLDDSYSEMHHAWDSVENFLKQLFGGNIEELSERGHSVFVDLNGLPSKHTGEFLTKNTVNDETRSQQKDKEGKFLFGLFGQGGNSENPPIDQENGEAVDNIKTTESPLVMSSPATISEILDNLTHVQQLEESVTSAEFEVLNMVTEEKFTTVDSKKLSPQLVDSSKQSNLLAHENEHSTRKMDKPEISTASTQSKSITENAFADEDFIDFCISLLHGMQKSPRLLDEFNDLEGSGSVGLEENKEISEVAPGGQILTESSQQRPQSMGFFASLLNRITGGRSRHGTSPSTITDPSPSTITDPSHNLIENENRKARIFNFNNLFGNFGSGRAADLNGFENLKLDDMDLNKTINGENNVLTASDCEEFFRHIQDSPFLIESNILNRSTLIEQKPGLKEDISSEESTSFTTQNLQDVQGKSFFNGLLGSNDTINLKLENTVNMPNVSTVTNLVRETTTVLPDDERGRNVNDLFGNVLTTGSESSKLLDEKKLLLRSFFNGGSGGREISEDSLSDRNTENSLTLTTASPDLRIFPGFFNFGSGERNIGESFQFESDNIPDAGRDENERTFGEFFGFGSGERRIHEKDEFLSTNITTNEILNFEDSSVHELPIQDQYNETDLYYERNHGLISAVGFQTRMAKEERQQDRRFIEFPSAGSGNGRNLEENVNSVSKNESKPGCSVICSFENGTDTLIKCSECSFGSTTDVPLEEVTVTLHNSTESEIAPRVISSRVEYADARQANMLESYQTDDSSQRDSKNTITNQLTENPIDGTTATTSKNKESILTGKIFLTINENGEFNLVQETEPSSSFSPRNARRGRLVDDPSDSKDIEHENHFNDISTNGQGVKDFDDFQKTSSKVTSTSQESTKPLFDDIVPTTKTERSEGEFIGSLSTLPSHQDISEHGNTNSPELLTESSKTFMQKRFGSEARYCITDAQCDTSLNERCTSQTFMGICDCGMHLVRHSVTGKCEDPFRLKAQLRFPEEAFRKVLKDENSDYFHKMRKDSVITMRLLIGHDQYLRDALVRVDVQDFEEGSLIINYDLTFAKEQSKSFVEFMQRVDIVVTEALKNEDMMKKTPLNTINAQLVSMGTFAHRCDSKELNYCSVNAKCIPFGDQFKCKCKDGYRDNSRDGYTGEVCVEHCPPDYCGVNGYCDMRDEGEKNCLCRGWYFGERCQIPGLLVIGGFGVVNIAVVLIILGIVCICRKRRQRKSRYYGSETPTANANESFGRLSSMPSRLRDTVAMNEMAVGGAKMYALRSTPMQGVPEVNVISPSVEGSSICYESDSTFDRSVTIEEMNKTARL